MDWWKSRWAKMGLVVLAGALGVYGLVYLDVVSRARASYEEGEKYMDWYRHPEKKKEFFDQRFEADKAKLTEPDLKEKLDALAFDRDYALSESSLKYAYQWYKDTYELFSPPESKWVKMARVKAPETLELWKQELREQKIPFEDTTFD